MTEQKALSFHTRDRGTHDITAEVERVVRASKARPITDASCR